MEQLWAPWRMAYVAQSKEPPNEGDCFLCSGLAGPDDRASLLALRTPHSAVFLNRYPYNSGHLLVVPRAHKATLAELTVEELLDSMETVRKVIATLQELMRPDGFNVGVNLGRAAGAGVPGHLHWHVVPRWGGDTNFMPVIGDVNVIVQALDALYDLLKAKWGP